MHSHNNGLKTALLMGSMVGMMLLIGGLLSATFRTSIFIWVMGLFSLGSVAYTYWNSDKLALRSMNAYPVSREEVPVLYDIVEELSSRAGQPMPALYVAPTMTPNAFATGRNPQNAAVCCTEGILQLLNERELRGVLGHELMHVYNRDILTSSVAAAMASIMTSIAQFILFFGGGSRDNREGGVLSAIGGILLALLAPFAATLIQFSLSRTREYDADEDGAYLTEDPLALASALKKLESGNAQYPLQATPQTQNVSAMMIANPFRGKGLRNLFSTHPPMDQRIARLEHIAGY